MPQFSTAELKSCVIRRLNNVLDTKHQIFVKNNNLINIAVDISYVCLNKKVAIS